MMKTTMEKTLSLGQAACTSAARSLAREMVIEETQKLSPVSIVRAAETGTALRYANSGVQQFTFYQQTDHLHETGFSQAWSDALLHTFI